MLKRILLFGAVNILVVMTLSILIAVLGLDRYFYGYGLDYFGLAAACLVWGMGGAFISLGISRIAAKTFMGVRVIPQNTADPAEQALLQTVGHLARAAGIPMPEVGIYESDEVNAFATGPTKKRSLVAVSTGLLRRMNRPEVEGVLSHEVAHIANGDMVTMTLLQGVVNAFVMFLARIIAYAVAQAVRGDRDRDSGISMGVYFAVRMAVEMVLLLLGMLVVASFSRYREYRADAGGARLGSRENMIRALRALQRNVEMVDPNAQPALATLKISGVRRSWFSTHPPLEERIARLERMVG